MQLSNKAPLGYIPVQNKTPLQLSKLGEKSYIISYFSLFYCFTPLSIIK